MSNTIWSLKDGVGREISNFEGLAELGRSYFENFFKAPKVTLIDAVVQTTLLFSSSVDEEGNKSLMALISKEEL